MQERTNRICMEKKYTKINFIGDIYVSENIDISIFDSGEIHKKIIVTGIAKTKDMNDEYFKLCKINKFNGLENITMLKALGCIYSFGKGYFRGLYGIEKEVEIYIDSIKPKE